ncbi:MAG: flagellar protein FlgN [Frankiales bacterium]|nr:flagellar protein FlgN [Frankiales bacterium]
MEQLADTLGRERLHVELLVYRLIELRQLLVAGEGRFLGWAAEEVERAARAVRQCELTRAVAVSSFADAIGISDEHLDLAGLVSRADEPWRTMLVDHGDALRSLAAEVDDQSAAVRRLSGITSRVAGARIETDAFTRVSAEQRP